MAHVREVRPEDLPDCGNAMYEAFRDIAERHGFPPDFPSAEAASGLLGALHSTPGFDALLAEEDNKIVGSIFVSRRSPVGGISILTVDPRAQDRRLGKTLMQEGMQLLKDQGHPRQQLVQAAHHNRSLCLYTKLGFTAVGSLSNMIGEPIRMEFPGYEVRPAREDDVTACNRLCRNVHGFDRASEVENAIAQGSAVIVERDGRITGYSTGVGFIGHGVGESNEDLKALIGSAEEFTGPGILIPSSNGELLRWCLAKGLKLRQQMILMDTDRSAPATEPYWPAVLC